MPKTASTSSQNSAQNNGEVKVNGESDLDMENKTGSYAKVQPEVAKDDQN